MFGVACLEILIGMPLDAAQGGLLTLGQTATAPVQGERF